LPKSQRAQKFYLGIFIALLVAIIESIIPYIYGHLVDMVLQPNFQILLVVKIIVFWLTISVVAVFLNRYSNRCSYEVAIDLSNNLLIDLYHHLLCLPMRFHKEKKLEKFYGRSIEVLIRCLMLLKVPFFILSQLFFLL